MYKTLRTILCPLLLFNLLIILFPGLTIGLINLVPQQEIEIYNHESKQTINLQLEEYLKGVLAAEMPARFSISALKAQAVAARTYTLKKIKAGQTITTDSTKDQAWISKDELIAKWGLAEYLYNWAKISSAVESTEGLVLSYNQKLISAVYHSTSGGTTASAKEVWGRKIPYLAPVTSSYETASPYYKQHFYFSYSQLANKLTIPDLNPHQLQVINRSPSGRVLKLQAGNVFFSGQKIRQKLKLPSTRFRLIRRPQGVKFITSGYGHGVGLSQYGAQGMAQRGYNFTQILRHYYQGANFKKIN